MTKKEEKLRAQIASLKKEVLRYRRGYEILNEYFDSISYEEKVMVDRKLRRLKLY